MHENYIIAQTADGMVIVDQHAAHERLVYEKLKNQMAANGVAAQALLIPEIVELSAGDAALCWSWRMSWRSLAWDRALWRQCDCGARDPAILGEVNAEAMLRDILDELADQGDSLLASAD